MNYQEFKEYLFVKPPGDPPWSDRGFRYNDYTNPDFSEMSAHMPLLKMLASLCKDTGIIVEFGTRGCNSTVAFMEGKPKKLISYDIQSTPEILFLHNCRERNELPCEWEFRCQNTLDPKLDIDECDLLFLDTLHTAPQLYKELQQENRVRKWLVCHDSYTQKILSIDQPGSPGIGMAIDRFMSEHPEWELTYQVEFNHGLTILSRTNPSYE